MPEDKCWCGSEVYEGDKCIFHCEKTDWYIKDNKGNRDWSKSEEKCKKFWDKFREELAKNETNDNVKEHDFTGIIFPKTRGSIFSYIHPSTLIDVNEFNKSFNFKGAFFYSDFSFSETNDIFVKFNDSVSFSECKFKEKIFFQNSIFSNLLFNKAIFLDEVSILDIKCSKLFFRESSFYKDSSLCLKDKEICVLILNGAKSINGSVLNIGNSFEPFFSKEIRELNVKFQKVTFEENNWFYFNSVFFDDCKFKANTYIMEDYENEEKHKRSEIIFSNPTFEENGSVFIENVAVDSFKLAYFTNSAKIFRLTDVCVNSKLSFYHSNLSRVEFNNFDVSKAKEINLENASFIGSNGNSIFNGVNWGENLGYRLEKATRDTLRQLKHVNDLQGNIIDANVFYSLEMNEYFWQKKSISQGLVFSFGKLVSNFSQNWMLPFFWYFAIGLFFYNFDFLIKKNIDFYRYPIILFFSSILIFIFLISKSKHFMNLKFAYRRGIYFLYLTLNLFLLFLGILLYYNFCNYNKVIKLSIVLGVLSLIVFFTGYLGTKNLSLDKKFLKGSINLFVYLPFVVLSFIVLIYVVHYFQKEKEFLSFINPFNTEGILHCGKQVATFPFILFKLFSVFLGYQLVTSLRHYTRRK